MVFRAVLSLWFLVASVLTPAFCCCVARAFAQPDSPLAAATPKAAKSDCHHDRRTAPDADGATRQGNPQPGDSGGDRCRCQDHVVTSAAQDPVTFPAAQQNDWLAAVSLRAASPFARPALGEDDPLQSDRAGPPPPAGIELLRRIHVLIC